MPAVLALLELMPRSTEAVISLLLYVHEVVIAHGGGHLSRLRRRGPRFANVGTRCIRPDPKCARR